MTRTITLGSTGLVALVDDDDYEAVAGAGPWYLMRRADQLNYAQQGPRSNPRLLLHSFLTGFKLTDHRNHNGLDNQRANLREASQTQNLGNQRARSGGSSRYKGVSWNKRSRKWRAEICVSGKRQYLGIFADELAAAAAYDNAARDLFGEFACMNLIEMETAA